MITQRTQGLYRLFLLCQIAIVAGLFWFGVWVMVTFYSPGANLTWNRYSIYCATLVIGLLGAVATFAGLVDGASSAFSANPLAAKVQNDISFSASSCVSIGSRSARLSPVSACSSFT